MDISDFQDPHNYIVVGGKYYLLPQTIDDSSSSEPIPMPNSRMLELFPDREERKLIPVYLDFIFEPGHVDFKQVVNNYYWNKYRQISPPREGSWLTINRFLKHIFGEQYHLGIIYLSLLYLMPRQKLPVLVLVSEERGTGKTTFLDFLCVMFRENATILTNEDIKTRFNNHYINKLVVGIDETLLTAKKDSEKIKSLVTAPVTYVEAKGLDRVRIEPFIHFVICSNNVYNPIIIDQMEDRYWVLEVPPIDCPDTELLAKMQKEVPAFLYFLKNQELSQPKGRLYFDMAELETEALRRIKHNRRPWYVRTVALMVLNIMNFLEKNHIDLTKKDLENYAKATDNQDVEKHIGRAIRQILPGHEKHNTTYDQYVDSTGAIINPPLSTPGRFYSFDYEAIKKFC